MSSESNIAIELGKRLRRLRQSRAWSLDFVARKANMSTAKLSRIETGAHLPSRSDVDFLLDFFSAEAHERSAIINTLRELTSTRELQIQLLFGRPNVHRQSMFRETELHYKRFRTLDCKVVPGLLQTAPYSQSVFRALNLYDDETIEQAVRARMTRQTALFDSDKSFEFIVTEDALRARYLPVDEMRIQYHHIVSLITFPNIRLGIVRASEVLPVWPYEFSLYDDTVSYTECRPDVLFESREEFDIRRDVTTLERLEKIALWDEHAISFVQDLAKNYSPVDNRLMGQPVE